MRLRWYSPPNWPARSSAPARLRGFNVAGSLGFAVGSLVGGTLVGAFRTLRAEPYAMVFVIVGALEIVVALAMVPVWRRSVTPGADSAIVGA